MSIVEKKKERKKPVTMGQRKEHNFSTLLALLQNRSLKVAISLLFTSLVVQ